MLKVDVVVGSVAEVVMWAENDSNCPVLYGGGSGFQESDT